MLSMARAARIEHRDLLKRFWKSARGFWGARGDRLAWVLTGGLLVLIVVHVFLQYRINVWNRSIFDAIEKKDASVVLQLTAIFFPLVAASVACSTTQVFVRMGIQRHWRGWLARGVVGRWLKNGRYYQLNLIDDRHQNPEYRIAEDLRVATDAPVDFFAGVTVACLSAATFIVVLWKIGGSVFVQIFNVSVVVPGFLVVAAVVYAVVASSLMAVVGRHFVSVSIEKNQAEAEYRYALMRVRENGESIALLGGEAEERADIQRSFGNVINKWALLCGQHMRTTVVSQGSSLLAPVVPILLCAPKFLEGEMSLGQVMQAASAFAIVQGAFGWLVDNYPRLADWNGSARRIAVLMTSLDRLRSDERDEGLRRIKRGQAAGPALLHLDDLSVTLDDGTTVVARSRMTIEPGQRILVAGESGSGKSTLVRAIAGLWPWGSGRVDLGAGRRLFLLPQKPYIPSGSLARAVAYPGAVETWSQHQICAALNKVGLGHLEKRVTEEASWDQILSGGEKQRLAFARIILHRPDIIVLDEATSALDARSQSRMMTLLDQEMRDAAIVSVAHRAELEVFHGRKVTLERCPGGARLVSRIQSPPHPVMRGAAASL
ncbi:ABC transporter ATP-binding protein/permease [Bradyrhizobium sp. SYSU BS000235]|uniref:ABC transporter ATP-binding protein/permease n=1 Tax=Bradyrhizobium sp. SYSU BS000235 TaxID=3411332 RepID=UPI003C743254